MHHSHGRATLGGKLSAVLVAAGSSVGLGNIWRAPDMVFTAAERLGVKREDCLYIGDSEVDLQTAKNAGMDCISVCWGFRDAEFLKQAGATQLVHTPKELEKLLLGESDNLEHKNKR